jgi:chemotaxis protein MotB
MEALSWIIEKNKMRVFIEGHTAASAFRKSPDYGLWELSADRANASRRALISYALEPKWIVRLSGYGDTQPLPGTDPKSQDNQRITLNLNLLK